MVLNLGFLVYEASAQAIAVYDRGECQGEVLRHCFALLCALIPKSVRQNWGGNLGGRS